MEEARQPFQVKWVVHPSPYGVPYYHNPATGESRWVLPTGPYDVMTLSTGASPDVTSPSQEQGSGSGAKGGQEEGACGEAARPGAEAASAGAGQLATGPAASPPSSSSASCSEEEEPGAEPSRADAAASSMRSAHACLEGFSQLLLERGVGQFDKYEAMLPQLVGDARFSAVPPAHRKQLFQREAKKLGEKRRREAALERRSRCCAFAKLLVSARERNLLRSAETSEEALEALEASDLGAEACWRATPEHDRGRLVAAALQEDLARRREEHSKAARGFRKLVWDKLLGPAQDAGREPPRFAEARRLLRADPQWSAVGSVEVRQRLYAEMAAEASRRWLQQKRRLAEEEDELTGQRKRHRGEVVEADFRGALALHVKAPLEVSWEEACVLLDGVEMPGDLHEAERERIFNAVRGEEVQRRTAKFVDALRHLSGTVGPEADFQAAYNAATQKLDGEVSLRAVPTAELRSAWEVWRRARLNEAVELFGSLLKQTELGHGLSVEAVCRRLADDPRYKQLDAVPEKRRALIMESLTRAH